MHLALLTALTPSPTPSAPPAELVTPGPIGFAVIAVLTVVVFLLVFDMLRRIRRARYRSEVNDELDELDRSRAETDSGDDRSAGPAGDAPRRS